MASKNKVTESDILHLKSLLSSTSAKIFAPSDDGYSSTIERWSRAAEKPAGFSVVPTTPEEISIAVKYATEHNIDLAVKGGGHSTAGASSTDGGILINLSAMRGVRVDAEAKLLYVQGGALWSDVDKAAWEHGLATVGGTVADTGVGGLTLGGGYGHLSGKYGLTIDNMVEATVVTANGEIVNTSESEHPDLFWAILGAGQNFGVVVEFVMKAYPQGEALTGTLIYPPTPEVVQKLVAVANDLYSVHDTPGGPQTKAKGQCASLIGLAKPPPAGGQTVILVMLSYVGSKEGAQEVIAPFEAIGPIQNTLAWQPWPVVNNQVPATIGMRSSMKGAAFVLPLRADFVFEVVKSYEEFVGATPDAAASLIAFELYDAVKITQGTAGSFANRGYHMNGLVMPTWSSPENDKVSRQWARDVSNMFKAELEKHGQETGEGVDGGVGRRGHKGAVMLYGNYDQYDEISKDIFGENYPRLQRIKKTYDPTNMFNKLFAITPA